MRFGLDIAQQRMPWSEIVAAARFADELGFDGVWGFDHFQPMYGDGPGECFEGNTTLAALAALTDRVRLGLLVTGMTYRHPSVFAAEAITIDHASGGRLELAVRRGVVRQGAHRARDPVPADAGPRRRVRGGGADRARTAHDRRLHVRGPALPGARRDAAAATGAATAPADLDRRVGREAHDADRGALRRRVALLRRRRAPGPTSRRRIDELAEAAGRDPAAIRGPRRSRSRPTSTTSRARSTNGTPPASTTSCAAGRARVAVSSSSSRPTS